MRILLAIGGVALLLLVVGGAAYLIADHELLKGMVVDGTPVFFDHSGRQVEISGRVVGTVAILVPIFGLMGGVWLLRLAFGRNGEHNK